MPSPARWTAPAAAARGEIVTQHERLGDATINAANATRRLKASTDKTPPSSSTTLKAPNKEKEHVHVYVALASVTDARDAAEGLKLMQINNNEVCPI